MSSFHFTVNIETDVCIPLDQIYDSKGNIVDENTPREIIKKALLEEITAAAMDQIHDRRFLISVDSKEIDEAINLFNR